MNPPATPDTRPVFVSYAWGGESERIVDELEAAFTARGLPLARDKKVMGFKDSIRAFEDAIGRGQCILLVISDRYLRSQHCMYELLKIEDNRDLWARVFPIVLADAKIYRSVDRLDYIRHWNTQIAELNQAILDVGGVANLTNITADLDLFTRIRASFDRLSALLGDMNALTPETHAASGYAALLQSVETALRPPPPASGSAPPPSQPPAPVIVIELDSLRMAYLDSLIADCQRARLVGIDPKSADPRRKAFSLEKLYISLDTQAQVEIEQEKDKKSISGPQAEKKMRQLSALEAVIEDKGRRIVLLGLPGSGKTTFVRYLSLRHAQACRAGASGVAEELPGWQGPPLLPVIVPLGRLAESFPAHATHGSAELVETYLRETLRVHPDEAVQGYADYLLEDLRRRPCMFLFDGLDEVADLAQRPLAVQAVEAFAQRYASNQKAHRFLVTCRTFSYTDEKWQLVGWPVHRLAAFTPRKVEEFVDSWHNESIHVDPGRREDYEKKRGQLKSALRRGDRRRLWEIADNPLILTLMAVVHTTRGELPDARALVYEECTRQLLIQWEAERPVSGKPQRTDLRTALDVPEITLSNALQEVAYHAHQRQNGDAEKRRAALVTEDLLWADLMAAFDSEDKVRLFLSYCESANGLLLWQGVAPLPDAPPDSPPRRVYAFPHLTFQEYLAARYLGRMTNLGDRVREHLDRSDRWREVVMLLGEHICFRDGNYEQMDSLLLALAPLVQPARAQDADWRALWMACDLLMLYRRAFPRRAGLHGHIPDRLATLLQSGALSPLERASAGETLARLGDPRFSEAEFFLPFSQPGDVLGFVPIPAGPFLMGSAAEDDSASDDERPQHELSLAEYYLARYPVSVAQFKAYAEESGRRPQYANLDALANHPVVNVTWYEALAYTRWLEGKLRALGAERLAQGSLAQSERTFWERLARQNWRVCLPSEAEWEKAARGGDGRLYPWGDVFDPDCANTGETQIGGTSALGCFPAGASPYGLLEMSGNVWEWTRSHYKLYPYDLADGREDLQAGEDLPRVLRGGSFNDVPRDARCSCRGGNYPLSWYDNRGFRVGVSAPIYL